MKMRVEKMNQLKTKNRLKLILALVIILSGFYLRYISVSETYVKNILSRDSKEYFTYAYNISHYGVYSIDPKGMKGVSQNIEPDAKRSPGYPLLVSVLIDHNSIPKAINYILLLQIIISTFTMLIAFLFYQKFLPYPLSIVALILTAISPHLIVANSYILTETLFSFMIMLFCFQMSIFIHRPSTVLIFGVGILGACANLVRPTLIFFLIALVFYLLYLYGRKKGLKFCIVFVIGISLFSTPWLIRNLKAIGNFSDKTLMINFLHHGMYPDFKFKNKKESYGFPYRYDPRSAFIRSDLKTVLREIKIRSLEKPFDQAKWYLIKKPIAFWSWRNVQGNDIFIYTVKTSPYFSRDIFKITYIFMKLLHWPIIIIGFWGVLIAWLPVNKFTISEQSLSVARFCSLLLLYYTALHMLGFPAPRYSIPIRPLIYGMAMYGIYFTTYVVKMVIQYKLKDTRMS